MVAGKAVRYIDTMLDKEEYLRLLGLVNPIYYTETRKEVIGLLFIVRNFSSRDSKAFGWNYRYKKAESKKK